MEDGRLRGRLRWGTRIGVAVVAGLLSLSVIALPPASSNPTAPGPPPAKVQICHATASRTNPYVSNEPAIGNNGDLQGGHLDHKGPVYPADDWGDIIPPYTYIDAQGQTRTSPGYNWTAEGQLIWQNGCKPGLQPLTPFVTCITPGPGSSFVAHFGYTNPNKDAIVDPFVNEFTPEPADRNQPTTFDPGTTNDAVRAASSGGDVTWSLTGNTATATSDSPSCQGSITVAKVLDPSTDEGRFNLLIDGASPPGATGVGDGGTTGTIAVDAGVHHVGESAAGTTDLAHYDIQIVCRDTGGAVVAQGTSETLAVPVQKEANVICTITNTHKQLAEAVVPELSCVALKGGKPYIAFWGYRNDNDFPVEIPVGASNAFSPVDADQGQPTVFQPGEWTGQAETVFDGHASIVWNLDGKSATASAQSPRCTATIELRKVTVPADDPGMFHLLLQGHVVATGGNGTKTGPITVGVGEGTVSETGAQGTSLDDYDSTIDCTRNGQPGISVSGTKVDGEIANGDVVVCTFTNTRKKPVPPPTTTTTPTTPTPPTPPTPPAPPTPPTPPGPPAPPPPPPPPSTPAVDLGITKTGAPASVELGQKITWTVRVTNHSTADASDVNVVKVNERSYRAQIISIKTSQGSCSKSSCDLGRLAPGASATITAVTVAKKPGQILNVVRVGSEEKESDYANNVAGAVVNVTRPFAPPVGPAVVALACHSLTAAPDRLVAGTTSVVLISARSRFVPLRGMTVYLRGLGLDRNAKTNAKGVARFVITPPRTGLVLFGRGRRLVVGAKAPCTTRLGVLTAAHTPVTG